MSAIASSGPVPGSNIAEYSVTELSGALKRTVEETYGHVRVRGEISGYRGPHSSGHAYFALKDDRCRIEAVVWRTSFANLAFKPEEGLEVVATGKLTTYPGSSKYQIVIEDLKPAGAGALMALLNERRVKLEAEGLFAASAKRRLPFMPRVIGIVTSPTGAVIRDICHRISDRFPVHLLVWPVRVQGETSAAEVAGAIAGFNALPPGGTIPRPDLLIVARGGGSLEDLWGFNDEAVVRAAAASTIPLISAVGHETDWTLLDHAADARAPTPTGAAEMAVPVCAEIRATLAACHARHVVAISRNLSQERRAVAALARALPAPDAILALPRRRVDEAGTALERAFRAQRIERRHAFDRLGSRLHPLRLESVMRERRAHLRQAESHGAHALARLLGQKRQHFGRLAVALRPQIAGARIAEGRQRLGRAAERLDAALARARRERAVHLAATWRMAESLDPRRVLERGYAIIRGEGDVPITRADELAPGTPFEVEFAGGSRRAALALDKGATGQAARPRRTSRQPLVGGDRQGDLF